MHLIIPGEIRSKKNSKQIIMVGGKNCPKRPALIPSKAYKKWEKSVRAIVKTLTPPTFMPFLLPVSVQAAIYFKGRSPDLSGALESIGDAFEGILWFDDRLIQSWDGSRLYHDIKKPRIELDVQYVEVTK